MPNSELKNITISFSNNIPLCFPLHLLSISSCLPVLSAFHWVLQIWKHHYTCSTCISTWLGCSMVPRPSASNSAIQLKEFLFKFNNFFIVTFFSLYSVLMFLDFSATIDTVDHFLTPLFYVKGPTAQHRQLTYPSFPCTSFTCNDSVLGLDELCGKHWWLPFTLSISRRGKDAQPSYGKLFSFGGDWGRDGHVAHFRSVIREDLQGVQGNILLPIKEACKEKHISSCPPLLCRKVFT